MTTRISRPPAQVVVFDLDDTLYPERAYVRSGYAAVAANLAERSVAAMLPAGLNLEAWLWQRFLAFLATGDYLPGFAGGAFDAMNHFFEMRLSKSEIDELVRVYRTHSPSIAPYEGAADMLSRLRPHFKLALLSDGYQYNQGQKLDALRLGRFFDVVIFTGELTPKAWKPSTQGYELIRSQLDVPHEACVYVADNPAKDFVAPNRLGWLSVQMLRPGQIHAANAAAEGGQPRLRLRLPGELWMAIRG